MSQSVSPWSISVDRISPNGRYRAVITDAWEVAMGGPTSGILLITEIADGLRTVACFDECNPSLVWSSDSTALAVPQWIRGGKQNLMVVAVPGGNIIAEATGFRVLELHAFEGRMVKGVDSPAYMPRAFEFVLEDIPGSVA